MGTYMYISSLSALDIRQGSDNTAEFKCCNWVDGLEIAAINQDEELIKGTGTGRTTNLATSESLISFIQRNSTAQKEQFLSNSSILKMLQSTMSLLPISTILPPPARIPQDASRSSPTKELIMQFTPQPPIPHIISCANFVLREANIRLRGIP